MAPAGRGFRDRDHRAAAAGPAPARAAFDPGGLGCASDGAAPRSTPGTASARRRRRAGRVRGRGFRRGRDPARRGGSPDAAGRCAWRRLWQLPREVDGVAFVRTCQMPARPGWLSSAIRMRGRPPSGSGRRERSSDSARARDRCRAARGGGRRHRRRRQRPPCRCGGRRSRAHVLVLDAGQGDEVVAVYPGPTVVARTRRRDASRRCGGDRRRDRGGRSSRCVRGTTFPAL